MLLGFKDRFVPYIVDGAKRHTIRGLRKGRLTKPATVNDWELTYDIDPWAPGMRFWDGRLPFEGRIIHWDYDGRFWEFDRNCSSAQKGVKACSR